MELEIYTAFRKVGIEDKDAREVVESINKEIDRRYNLHAQQLATRGDLAEAKADIIKWTVGAVFAAVGLFATLTKLFH